MVSEISLSGYDWGLDGRPGEGTPEYRKERIGVLEKAIDLGVNYIDATNNYEGGILGQRLRESNARDKFIIAYGDSDNFVTHANEDHLRKPIDKRIKLVGRDIVDIFMVFDFPIGMYARDQRISLE